MKKIIYTIDAPQPIGPYSQAVLAGNFLYVSGQIPLDAISGELVNESIEKEATQVMTNIEVILKQAGMGWKDVVKTTIFLTDMGNFASVNKVYGAYFSDNYPARETVEVSRLPKDVNVEISVIAVKSE
jgi:2-iminobutanoate/2-iminopropanoate deaminase